MNIDYLILAGGRLPNHKLIQKLEAVANEVVTVDHGAVGALKLSLSPSLHVGDGDSFSKSKLKKLKAKKIVSLNQDKSISDLEYALTLLPQTKIKVVLGAHSNRDNRADHGLANFFLLNQFNHLFYVGKKHWLTGAGVDEFSFSAPKKTVFSIIPLQPNISVSLKGGVYSLTKQKLRSPTHGLHNKVRDEWVHIKADGPVILFVQSDFLKSRIKSRQ